MLILHFCQQFTYVFYLHSPLLNTVSAPVPAEDDRHLPAGEVFFPAAAHDIVLGQLSAHPGGCMGQRFLEVDDIRLGLAKFFRISALRWQKSFAPSTPKSPRMLNVTIFMPILL